MYVSEDKMDILVKEVLKRCIENDEEPFDVIEYDNNFAKKVNEVLEIEQEPDVEDDEEEMET